MSTSKSFSILQTFLVISNRPFSPPYSSTFGVLRVASSPSFVYLVSQCFSPRVARISAWRICVMNWMKYQPWRVMTSPVLGLLSVDFSESKACSVSRLASYAVTMISYEISSEHSMTNMPVLFSLYVRAFCFSVRTTFLPSALMSKYFVALLARFLNALTGLDCPCCGRTPAGSLSAAPCSGPRPSTSWNHSRRMLLLPRGGMTVDGVDGHLIGLGAVDRLAIGLLEAELRIPDGVSMSVVDLADSLFG